MEAIAFLSSADARASALGYEGLGAPAVLIFGDDPARRDRFATIAGASGARLVAAQPIADAHARLELQAEGLVILDVTAAGGATLDRLVDRVGASAGRRLGGIVIAPRSMIDVVATALDWPWIDLLIDPEDEDVAAAIEARVVPREAMLADGGVADPNGERLRQLSEEVGRIARTLAGLSSGVDAHTGGGVLSETDGAATRLQTARTEIRMRRLREQFLDRALFADPAWDMLLDLAAADLERRRVAVSSLCIAAAVPPTTALRWIAQMTDHGLLSRYPDPDDGRRVFVALTAQANEAMIRYLDAAGAIRAGT